MRPFALTMQSQRLDVQHLGLALLAGALVLGLAWGGFAAPRGSASTDAPGQCVEAWDDHEADTSPLLDGPDPRCPADDLPYPPELRGGQVVFTGARDRALTVEIAELGWEQRRGLMYRTHLPEDHGMLLTYGHRGEQAIWMHNTCIPLDVLFVDDDGTIVAIREHARPMDDSAYRTRCPSRHVIEVNAGWCRRHGVRPGQKVRLVGV